MILELFEDPHTQVLTERADMERGREIADLEVGDVLPLERIDRRVGNSFDEILMKSSTRIDLHGSRGGLQRLALLLVKVLIPLRAIGAHHATSPDMQAVPLTLRPMGPELLEHVSGEQRVVRKDRVDEFGERISGVV